MIKSVLFSN